MDDGAIMWETVIGAGGGAGLTWDDEKGTALTWEDDEGVGYREEPLLYSFVSFTLRCGQSFLKWLSLPQTRQRPRALWRFFSLMVR